MTMDVCIYELGDGDALLLPLLYFHSTLPQDAGLNLLVIDLHSCMSICMIP